MLGPILIGVFVAQVAVFAVLRVKCAKAMVVEQGANIWAALAFDWVQAKAGKARRYRDMAVGWLLLTFVLDMIAAIIIPNVIGAMG